MGDAYDLAVERSLAKTIATGMQPIGVLADDNGEGQWIDCTAGLIRMPVVQVTSRGLMRYYRRPLPGELVNASKSDSPDCD